MTNDTQSNFRKNLSLHQACHKKETTYICMRLVHTWYVYMHETYIRMRHMHMYETIYVYIIFPGPIIRHVMLKDAVSASASAS